MGMMNPLLTPVAASARVAQRLNAVSTESTLTAKSFAVLVIIGVSLRCAVAPLGGGNIRYGRQFNTYFIGLTSPFFDVSEP